MVPPKRRRRRWPLQLAAVLATAGIVALGFQAWIEDRRWARLAAEIRTLRTPRADDTWSWCTSTIARTGGRTARTTPAEAFRQSYERGFRAVEFDLASPSDMTSIVELARAHPTVHWLLVHHGARRGALEPVVQALLDAPALLDRVHPVLDDPEDVVYALRVYPFPSIVYAPTEAGRQGVAAALFVRDAAIGVVVLPRETFTQEAATALAAVRARAYVSGVNDTAEARQLLGWGAAGVVTDSVPPRVICDDMLGATPTNP
jgi:hypothetical protein